MGFRFETPVIQTARLVLRPVRADDVPQVQAEFGRWAIIKNMTKGVPWPYPTDGAKHWFEQAVLKAYANKTESVWAITRREDTEGRRSRLPKLNQRQLLRRVYGRSHLLYFGAVGTFVST